MCVCWGEEGISGGLYAIFNSLCIENVVIIVAAANGHLGAAPLMVAKPTRFTPVSSRGQEIPHESLTDILYSASRTSIAKTDIIPQIRKFSC